MWSVAAVVWYRVKGFREAAGTARRGVSSLLRGRRNPGAGPSCGQERPTGSGTGSGSLGHLAAFLGAVTAGRGAVLAGLFTELVALGGARVTHLGAECAPLGHKRRASRHDSSTGLADLGALETQAQAVGHLRAPDTAVGAHLAGLRTLETG